MTGVKISALPAASAAHANDQLEVNQSGTTRRLTIAQLAQLTDGGGVVLASAFGTVEDGVTDDSVALNAAIAACIASGSQLYLQGVCRCLSDVPLVHQVALKGPGGIQLTGANIWRAEPSTRTGYAGRQTLYMSTTGNDSNSGLGPSSALLTLPAANTILVRYEPLVGTWSLTIAAGEYTSKTQFTAAGSGATFYIEAPATASAWNNTTPPADADATGGSVPLVLFRPALANRGVGAGICMDFGEGMKVQINDIKFRDWGTSGGTSDDGAVRSVGSIIYCINMHIWHCGMGVTIRDFSVGSVGRGIIHGCRHGVYCVGGARYTVGYQSTVPGSTIAPLIRQCVFGLDVWEDATGHSDYVTYEDNGTQIYMRRKAHCAAIGNTLRNTGGFGLSIGMAIAEQSISGPDATTIWTGTHSPRVRRTQGGMDSRLDNSYDAPQLVAWSTPSQTTSGVTVLTLCSAVIERAEFTIQPQMVHVRAQITLNNLLNTGSLIVRANGAFMTSCTFQLVPSTRHGVADIYLYATSGTTQLTSASEVTATGNGSASRVAKTNTSSAIDFTAAAVTLSVTTSCVNAADSITVHSCEIFRRG